MMTNGKNLRGIDNNVAFAGETESNHEFMTGYAVFRSRFEFTSPT